MVRELINTVEVAHLARCHPNHVLRKVRRGELPAPEFNAGRRGQLFRFKVVCDHLRFDAEERYEAKKALAQLAAAT